MALVISKTGGGFTDLEFGVDFGASVEAEVDEAKADAMVKAYPDRYEIQTTTAPTTHARRLAPPPSGPDSTEGGV